MSEHTPAPYRPRSVYGYALYIGSNMLFILYLAWAVVPDEFLHSKLGLTYWPLKYWAVATPIWALSAGAIFVLVIYPAINLLMTPDLDDITTIRDQYSLEVMQRVPGGIPPVSDIAITQVCRQLYLVVILPENFIEVFLELNELQLVKVGQANGGSIVLQTLNAFSSKHCFRSWWTWYAENHLMDWFHIYGRYDEKHLKVDDDLTVF